jgi:hypothetical protein
MKCLLKKNVTLSKEQTMVAPLVGLAVGVAARAVAKKAAKEAIKKSSKKVIKSAAVKKRTAATASSRGFAKDKASRKEMKQQDVFYNKVGKEDLKEGNMSGAAMANTPKSRAKAPKGKVPAKKTGKK